MKRIACALIALIMALTSVGFAQETEKLTAEALILQLAERFAGILQTGEFAFEYADETGSAAGSLMKDVQGMPVIEGSLTEDGGTRGLRVSREGVVFTEPGAKEGMVWADIAAIALKEAGLDGLMDISGEDIALVSGMFSDIAAGISREALSASITEDALNGVPARKLTIGMDVGRFLKELDAAASAALEKNAGEIDRMFARLDKLIRQTVPEISGMTAEELIAGWNGLGLSRTPLSGVNAVMCFTYTGSIADPWAMDFSVLGMGVDAWFDGEAFCFEINRGIGQKLVFDSRDLIYAANLILSGLDGISEEAFACTAETSNGSRRIRLSFDLYRMQRQALFGLINEVSARRETVDGLISRYRPWLELFGADAENLNVDALISGLSGIYARQSRSGVQRHMFRLGLGYTISDQMEFSLSYPIRSGAMEGSVQTGGFIGRSGAPVSLSVISGSNIISFEMDDTQIEASYISYLTGRKLHFTAETTYNGSALSAKLTSGSVISNRVHGYLALDADENGAHLYSDNGSVDVHATFGEDGVQISGTVDGDTITGSLMARDGLCKLVLSVGQETITAALRTERYGFELEVCVFGQTYAFRYSRENGFLAEIGAGRYSAMVSLFGDLRSRELSWDVNLPEGYSNGEVRFEGGKVSGHLMRGSNTSGYRNREAEFTLSYGPRDPGFYLLVQNNDNVGYEISYKPGHLTIGTRFVVLTVNDVTPVGSTGRNELIINAYATRASSEEEQIYTCRVTTETAGGRYRTVCADETGEIWTLTLDFDPGTAAPASGDVRWLTPEMLLLTREAQFIFDNCSQTPSDSVPDEDAEAVADRTPGIQRQLVKTGFLSDEMCSGVYDEATAAAIAEFQMWVNEMRGDESFVVNGQADELTVACLDYCADRWITRKPIRQAEEAAEETAAFVPEDPDAANLQLTHIRLGTIGLLSPESIRSGEISASVLRSVAEFQRSVNDQFGAGLTVINPDDPLAAIDEATFSWMFEKKF